MHRYIGIFAFFGVFLLASTTFAADQKSYSGAECRAVKGYESNTHIYKGAFISNKTYDALTVVNCPLDRDYPWEPGWTELLVLVGHYDGDSNRHIKCKAGFRHKSGDVTWSPTTTQKSSGDHSLSISEPSSSKLSGVGSQAGLFVQCQIWGDADRSAPYTGIRAIKLYERQP